VLQPRAEQDAVRGKRLLQPHEKGYLLCNPPAMPLFRRRSWTKSTRCRLAAPHPSIKEFVPAIEEVSFSITSARGASVTATSAR
jgi:hypothetical protein